MQSPSIPCTIIVQGASHRPETDTENELGFCTAFRCYALHSHGFRFMFHYPFDSPYPPILQRTLLPKPSSQPRDSMDPRLHQRMSPGRSGSTSGRSGAVWPTQ